MTSLLDKNEVIKYYLDKFLYNERKSNNILPVEYGIIARTFLTSSKAFKHQKNLDFRYDGDTGNLFSTVVSLPHFIWVVEFTTAGLYNEDKIFGEVVIDATAYKSDNPILYSRILDRVIIGDDVCKTSKKVFTLFKHNLGKG